MTTSLLVPPRELCETDAEVQAFERGRGPASLVGFAEVVENAFALRDVDWSALFRYASDHPGLIPVLSEAPAAIQRVFGPAPLVLDLVVDPEEAWEELFIVIVTTRPVDQALSQLRQLDANWFADAARRANFTVNVTVE